MPLRDHDPIVIENFNGLWKRGDPEEVPLDHWQDAENLRFTGSSGFATRYGINIFQDVAAPLGGILRIYNFITDDENTLLVLIDGGEIYHVINDITVLGPILTIGAMTDFDIQPWGGRVYITPFTTYGTEPDELQKGLENEFLY